MSEQIQKINCEGDKLFIRFMMDLLDTNILFVEKKVLKNTP